MGVGRKLRATSWCVWWDNSLPVGKFCVETRREGGLGSSTVWDTYPDNSSCLSLLALCSCLQKFRAGPSCFVSYCQYLDYRVLFYPDPLLLIKLHMILPHFPG